MSLKNITLLGCMAIMVACSSGEQKPKVEESWRRKAKLQTFLNLSVRESLDSSRQILDTLLNFYAADSLAMREMVAFLTPPLSDPNSQIRNEELYIPLLEAIIASPFYDSIEKIRPKFQLGMAMKNRAGFPATDFTYTLANGRQGTLYGIKTPFTIVYINNPDCLACEDISKLMARSELINNMIKSDKLTILAIYPDEDITAWKDNLKTFPREWINGYDADLDFRKHDLYDIRAIPSLYLLDNQKKVLLKDCTIVPLIEAHLARGNR